MAPSKNTDREVREARDRLRRYNARQSVHSHQISRRRRDNLIAIVSLIVVATVATASQVVYFTTGPGHPVAVKTTTPTAAPTTSAPQANVGSVPLPATAENRAWTGSITFNKDITLGITLDGAKAPQGVASFIADVKDKYLVGKTCHRLVLTATSGLIQCGSFDGKGTSDTGYSFGPIENAPADGVYPAGTIALARVGDNAYSQGHQFFIVLKPVKLPADTVGGYTIIGTVTSGLAKMLSTIAAGGVAAGGSSATDGPPVVATTITGLSIK